MKRIAIYHVETLLWISRLGTFRAAAERLNTTQPAISARVREIEEQLGITLFTREGRRMMLNARGRQLVQECEPLWAKLEEALLGASKFGGAQGVVRIGSGEIAAASCLPAFVSSIERDLPGVTLEIELDLTATMLQNLLSGRSDMVFLAGPVASPGIRTAPIGFVGLVWTASAAFAGRSMEDILPIWSLPRHSPIHGVVIETLAKLRQPRGTIHTCNNVRTLIEIISAGRGAALLPQFMIQKEVASGVLLELPPRPAHYINFEVAMRAHERDPLIIELFDRATRLDIHGSRSASR